MLFRSKRALVDLGNKLIVNYATDYANGVDINKLHLADHIKVSFWEERGEWNPGRDQWHTFYEQDTGLKWAEWNYTTMCEIGMYDGGTVENFWWVADNASYVNDAGNLVVKWEVNYYDTGPDWFPWHRAVFWLAFRR